MADADSIVVNTKLRSKKGTADENTSHTKKRKASAVVIHQNSGDNNNDSPAKKRKNDTQEQGIIDIDTSRPTAVFKPTKGRDWTVSIALPGSWLLNAKKPDHKTIQVGRIARAAAVFCVDEIVVFDDNPSNVDTKVVSEKYIRQGRGKKSKQEILDSILEEDEPWQNPDQFLYHVLSFAECPPHLRYDAEDPRLSIFQKHQNLGWVGCLPSMDMPHHLRGHEWCQYREGVVVGPASSPLRTKKSKTAGSEEEIYVYVKCGLPYPVRVPVPQEAPIEAGMRTTVRFADADPPSSWPHLSYEECENLEATACASSLPREESGYYWGYTVRRATSLSAVFAECEYTDGYDFTVGTSERGVPVHSILPNATPSTNNGANANKAPEKFNHLLIVFGGVAGIEPAVANDPLLVAKGLGKSTANELFDAWVNLVHGQGSRTIRTEEAVEFGLMALKPYIDTMDD